MLFKFFTAAQSRYTPDAAGKHKNIVNPKQRTKYVEERRLLALEVEGEGEYVHECSIKNVC